MGHLQAKRNSAATNEPHCVKFERPAYFSRAAQDYEREVLLGFTLTNSSGFIHFQLYIPGSMVLRPYGKEMDDHDQLRSCGSRDPG